MGFYITNIEDIGENVKISYEYRYYDGNFDASFEFEKVFYEQIGVNGVYDILRSMTICG